MYARTVSLSILACMWAAPEARAQFAVIDIGAITQLIAQVQILQDQLTTAREHLVQAQAEYVSMTGGRGMERLLSGTPRNYLPANWADLQAAMRGGGGAYGPLGGDVAASVIANSILSAQALSLLPADVREQIDSARRLAALQQNVARQALAMTSNRFASLQQLIDAIPAAQDQKGILDLQARIDAENSMLHNEQGKLLTLFQLVEAEKHANRLQVSERALVGHGEFATRFQPAP